MIPRNRGTGRPYSSPTRTSEQESARDRARSNTQRCPRLSCTGTGQGIFDKVTTGCAALMGLRSAGALPCVMGSGCTQVTLVVPQGASRSCQSRSPNNSESQFGRVQLEASATTGTSFSVDVYTVKHWMTGLAVRQLDMHRTAQLSTAWISLGPHVNTRLSVTRA